ncbi:MAG: acyltransferase, partial [Candidatus Hydrothermota bacterium]
PYCQRAMITRCLENRLFAVTANRYGRETDGKDTLEFTGQSQITGPRGDILLRAETEGDMLGVVEIDPEEALNKWITPKNHVLEDRRVELYRNLCPGTDHNDG